MSKSNKQLCACCGLHGEGFRKLSESLRHFVNTIRKEKGKAEILPEDKYRSKCYNQVFRIYQIELKKASSTANVQPEHNPLVQETEESEPVIVQAVPSTSHSARILVNNANSLNRIHSTAGEETGNVNLVNEMNATPRGEKKQNPIRASKRNLFGVPTVELSNLKVSDKPTSKLKSLKESSGESPSGKKFQTKSGIALPFKSARRTQERCFICKRFETLRRLPKGSAAQVFISKHIFVPFNNLACLDHFTEDEQYSEEALNLMDTMVVDDQSMPTESELTTLLAEVSDLAAFGGIVDFTPDSRFNDAEHYKLLGISKEHFLNLYTYVDPYIRNSKLRSGYNALAIFLMKLRLNLAHEVLAILFGNRLTKQRISYTFHMIRKILEKEFVPRFLGYTQITRERYIKEWHTKTADTLFNPNGNKAIYIPDGTYLYIQKSKNYKRQRKTYSMHKFRNLVKVMMMSSPSGYLLSVEGAYFADGKNNDAAILSSMTMNPNGFLSFAEEGDIIIYDRGFRDCNEMAKNLGFEVKMPHFLPKGQSQHTTREANESRLVTRVRWIVESVNARIKHKFKFFLHTIENSYLPTIGSIFKVACAIMNAYCPPLKSDNPDDEMIATKMLEKLNAPNTMKELVDKCKIRRTSVHWLLMDDDAVTEFPRLSEQDLRALTLGVYQIKQAEAYTQEHLDANGLYTLYYYRENPTLLMIKIQSRHSSSTEHKVWIYFRPNVNSIESICGWYCDCKAGARTVGCCAHIASVVWFLSYGRYQPRRHMVRDDELNIDDASLVEYDLEVDVSSNSESDVSE